MSTEKEKGYRTKRVVCWRCDGRGQHTNPSIYPEGGGFTQSEWAELDDYARDTYMSGGYDICCEVCKGKNVIELRIYTHCCVRKCENEILPDAPEIRDENGKQYCSSKCAEKNAPDYHCGCGRNGCAWCM